MSPVRKKKAKKTLNYDPRWLDLVEAFAFDLTGFAVQVCGMSIDEFGDTKNLISWQQIEVADEISVPGCRVSVASGHGSGKTRLMAVTALWHMTCYFRSNTIFTAPKIDQLRKQTWMEISDMVETMRSGPYAWLAEHIVVMDQTVFVRDMKKVWWVAARTAPKGSPENLAGAHRDWLLIWADEASGIPDPNFEVLNGALSDARNRFILTSQPTRPAGYFYNTHHSLSVQRGGIWIAITLNSEESPLVNEVSIENWIVEYGGKDSPLYGIKVLGKFPDKTDGYLLARSEIEVCFGYDAVMHGRDQYGFMLSIDVGAGEYRDNSVATIGIVSGYGHYGQDARRVQIVRVPVRSNTTNIQNFTGQVFHAAAEIENVTTLVDAGGMGIAVCQALEAKGIEVNRVKWGKPPWRKESKDMFFNLRAQAMVCASRAAKEGRLGFDPHLPNRNQIIDQASRIPYSFDEKARYVIEKKEEMRKMGIPSPDDWDSICFMFLDDVDYIIAEGGEKALLQSINEIKKQAEDLFADLA